MSKYKRPPLFWSWHDMKSRCSRKSHRFYKNYGERGITICEEWKEFKNFCLDMGERPKGFSLERIDNNKGYYKENCKWASRKEQNNNRSMCINIIYNGDTLNLKQAWEKYSEKLGITYRCFHKRFKNGIPIEIALFHKKLSTRHSYGK